MGFSDKPNSTELGTTVNWQQQYVYDRYGNRSINGTSTATWGAGINIMQMGVVANTTTNRMYAPGETESSHPTMNYDAAGNQTKDTYSAAAVTRAYDAENRMTSETQASSYVAGTYSYDSDGRRVKRTVGSTETWQVYGIGGELLAEYAANASYSSPQKEYGYRNGQMLVTVTCGSGWGDPPTLHDNPLVVGETTVQARHITELRTAIDALRAREGMSAYSWTTSATTSDYINADPIVEMRTALDQALGAPSGGYASGLASGQPIKAIHIQELRDRLTAAWAIDIRWLVTDQLGTPRMVLDQGGSLSGVSRHDYLPFGEEIFAGTGGRATVQGYSIGDGARQKFTLKERDNETGLDYFGARYYGSAQGRFTGADDFLLDTHPGDPQTWNLYSYVRDNPVRFTDPSGNIKRDENGNVIFVKEKTGVFEFKKKSPLLDSNSQPTGKTITITWKAEFGYVYADNGKKVKASKATGDMDVTVKDSKGKVLTAETAGYQQAFKDSGYSNSSDCHGTSFARGQVWINDGEVPKIIQGDAYTHTDNPQPGDIGVYTDDGNLRNTKHSVTVNSIDSNTGAVISVTSKGGITNRDDSARPGTGPGTAWPNNPNARLEYFTQRVSQKH